MLASQSPIVLATESVKAASPARKPNTIENPFLDGFDVAPAVTERSSHTIAAPADQSTSSRWLDRVSIAAGFNGTVTFVRPAIPVATSAPAAPVVSSGNPPSTVDTQIPFRAAFVSADPVTELPNIVIERAHEISLPENADPNAPVAVNDSVTVDEDGYVLFDPLANDTDADGDELTLSDWNVTPAHGLVVREDDGRLKYTPDPDYHGTDSISYTTAGLVKETSGTISVTVNSVNDAPMAYNDAFRFGRPPLGQPGPGGVWFFESSTYGPGHSLLTNDVDWDGYDLEAVPDVFSLGSGGTVTLRANGTYYWEFPDTFSGSVSFTYTAVDPDGGESEATATLWAMPPVPPAPPYPPIGPESLAEAVSDLYFVGDEPLSVGKAEGVLANDTVSDYPFFTTYPALDMGGIAVLLSAPERGRLTSFDYDGSFDYTPDALAPADTALAYRLYRTDGNSSDVCAVQLPAVQADIYHGQNGAKVVGLMKLAGAFTVANLNDSDYDGKEDRAANEDGVAPRPGAKAGFEGGEVDLLKFEVHKPNDPNPDGSKVKIEIKAGAGVKLWGGQYKHPNEAVALANNNTTKEYALADFPQGDVITMWVELTSPSPTVGDVKLEVTYRNSTPTTVRATGIWVDGTNQVEGNPIASPNAWQGATFHTVSPTPWPGTPLADWAN
jgi:Bacterial Ig domain